MSKPKSLPAGNPDKAEQCDVDEDIRVGFALGRRIWEEDVRENTINALQDIESLLETYRYTSFTKESLENISELLKFAHKVRRKVEQALRMETLEYLDDALEPIRKKLKTYFVH